MNAKTKSTMPETCGIRPLLNVERSANDLEGRVADLCDAVEALESRLGPLLGSERPMGCVDARDHGSSELSERILCSADKVGGASSRIRELIDRL